MSLLCLLSQQDKYVFPPAGAGGRLPTPSHKLNRTFKFRDYAPKVFKNLRGLFGIDEVGLPLPLVTSLLMLMLLLSLLLPLKLLFTMMRDVIAMMYVIWRHGELILPDPPAFPSNGAFLQASYMNSVAGDYDYLELITNSKSGSFFFYSHDQKYIIKNMKVSQSTARAIRCT